MADQVRQDESSSFPGINQLSSAYCGYATPTTNHCLLTTVYKHAHETFNCLFGCP